MNFVPVSRILPFSWCFSVAFEWDGTRRYDRVFGAHDTLMLVQMFYKLLRSAGFDPGQDMLAGLDAGKEAWWMNLMFLIACFLYCSAGRRRANL